MAASITFKSTRPFSYIRKDGRPGPSNEGVVEGLLTRKHVWESATKKSRNRSWDKVYVVLRGGSLLFYKDKHNFKIQPDVYFRGENPVECVELFGSLAEIASDYTKKKHVWRLKLSSGGECLFQAQDDEEMHQWIRGIQEVAHSTSFSENKKCRRKGVILH